MTEAEQTDYDNGYRGFFAGAPIQYYDFSGDAYRGWNAARRQHAENNVALDAEGYPQDGSIFS